VSSVVVAVCCVCFVVLLVLFCPGCRCLLLFCVYLPCPVVRRVSILSVSVVSCVLCVCLCCLSVVCVVPVSLPVPVCLSVCVWSRPVSVPVYWSSVVSGCV